MPVQITHLGSGKTEREGTNAFYISRWDVARHCDWRGPAIFMDGADMLMLADIAELWAQVSVMSAAVAVVKHDYRTLHPRKYLGTDLEADNRDYPRKNWSSVVGWDCGHAFNGALQPEFIAAQSGADLHRFAWLPDNCIAELDPKWNVLIGEQDPVGAKVAHFTLGIPGFEHYEDCPYADEWRATLKRALRGLHTHHLARGNAC